MFHRVYVSEYNVYLTFKNGKLHDYKNQPAVTYVISPYKWEYEHWFEGRRHSCKNAALLCKDAILLIRNGRVDIMVKKYNHRTNTVESTPIENYTNLIPHFEKTFHILNKIPLEKLGMKHREMVDSSEKGTIKIYYNGIQHSEIGPAELRENGTSVYYQFGLKHCEYGPAIIDQLTESKYWYYYGIPHNVDGPAYMNHKRNRATMTGYMQYGLMHRVDGPAYIKTDEQSEYTAWYQHGRFHRQSGPAIIHKSNEWNMEEEMYYTEGRLENLQGPAIVSRQNNNERRDYYIDDLKYSKKKYNKIMKYVKMFTHKMKAPLRKKLNKVIMKQTVKYSNIFCKDIVLKICEYVY